jgi:hypothetical protein
MIHPLLDWIALPVIFAVCVYVVVRRSSARLRALKSDKQGDCCDSCSIKDECSRKSCELVDNGTDKQNLSQ